MQDKIRLRMYSILERQLRMSAKAQKLSARRLLSFLSDLRICGMSSSKSWIMKSARRRFGWALVIAGAAFVASLATGNSLVVAVVAIGIVIVLSALLSSRGERSSETDPPSKRAAGNPYSISHAWKVDQRADLAEIARGLHDKGLVLRRESESSNEVVLRGGSQFWTRLFGGYFVDPRRLPIEVELRTANGTNGGKWTVQLGVRDRLGVAARDEALEDRFAQAAGSIREAIGTQLEAIGGVEVDSA